MSRTVCWFSCGAASAVATKLTLKAGPAEVVYCDTGSEHPDNMRFLKDCEAWFGQPIAILKSEKFADTWAVWEHRRFIVGPHGAPCTGELKKKLRYAFQRPDDVHVFGYTSEEAKRLARVQDSEPGLIVRAPLIERGLTKQDCLAMVDRAGIELPVMYRLGYHNANCVGCPHGALGYWNKIRVDFPETFDRMGKLERDLNHAINKDEAGPIFLDELDPERGDYPSEISPDCSILCAISEADL